MDVAPEYRRGVESALLDLNRDRIAALPRRPRGAGEDAPAHLPQLDVPLRPVVRGAGMQLSRAGAGMELLQP